MKYVIILLLIAPIIVFPGDEAETTLTRIGQQAPNFTVRTIEGGEFELHDLRGRVVLLNFFATWCSPCLQELPHLELEVWQKYKNDSFMLIAMGREHNKRDLVKFTDVVTFTFPMAPDPKREIYNKFATTYIPRNVLIDKSGAIIYQSVGYSEEEFAKMIVQIEKALSE